MKHFFATVSLIATVFTTTALTANQIGMSWSYRQRGNEVILTAGGNNSVLKLSPSNAKCEIDIPAEMKGCPVVEIGDYAFYNHQSVINFTISEGVKKIGKSAFYNGCSITTITIPEGVTEIGKSAISSRGQIVTFEGSPPAIKGLDDRNCEIRYHVKHAGAWKAVANQYPWKNAKLV